MERSDMVAGIAEQFMTNWTSQVFRDRCAAQIESARSVSKPRINSDDPMEKFLAQNSSKQLEEFVFSKSKTREDYVSLVAEMLMMLRQHGGGSLVNEEVLETASPADLEAAGLTPNGVDSLKKDQAEGGEK